MGTLDSRVANSEITACLIVRNEAARIVDCLDSIKDVVDFIVIYDTGSTDDTIALARAAGAKVIQGFWDDDFARARNVSLAAATTTWILSIDADDRFTGDGAQLRAVLAAAAENVDGYRTEIRNITGPDGIDSYYSYPLRVFRRARVRWFGLIHERLNTVTDSPLRLAEIAPTAMQLTHIGYADPGEARRKAARNATIGLVEFQELNERNANPASPVQPEELARVLLDLGRSLMACDQRQGAVDAFQGVRELPLRGSEFMQATDFTARLALGANQPDDAGELVNQLRAVGADVEYCDWLQAQVLAQQGDAAGAYNLLDQVHTLTDPAGRVYGRGQVVEMRALAAAMAGKPAEAVTEMVQAMARYGRVAGRGKLLLEWWGDQPVEPLWVELSQYGTTYLDSIRREFAACGTA